MTNVTICTDEVINPVFLPHLHNERRTQIFYGGSASGKSVFLAQRAVIDVMQGGRNYLICRAVAVTIRRSVFEEIRKLIRDWNLSSLFSVNKSEMVVTCSNGYQIMFSGLDDVEKLKSMTPAKGVLTDVWVEEATEAQQDDLRQLNKRLRGIDVYSDAENVSKRLTMSFNPILRSHWIYTDYFTGIGWTDDQRVHADDELSILKTTYKDNRFLTEEDRRDLEDESDEYFYNVYTLGNWGVLGDVIFTNWEVQDLSEQIAQFDNLRHGLDFGYASDPAAYVKTHYDSKHKIIYVFDELYQTGLDNEQLAADIKDMVGRQPIFCDSAEPKSIAELRKYGLDAKSGLKGPDSVRHGIQWLQKHKIIIDRRCVQFRQEIEQYQWKKDKHGQSMPIPIDKNNHGLDSVRYAYSYEMKAKTKINPKATVTSYISGGDEKRKRPGF
jgi:phage terminase large subunit